MLCMRKQLSMLKCLLFSAILLFRQGFSELSNGKDPNSYGINGTYFSLNTFPVSHSELSGCPNSITVHNGALHVGEGAQYFFNLSALHISIENCTFTSEEDRLIKFSNHTFSSERHGSLKYYTGWNMTLPQANFTCLMENASHLMIPGGNVSFVPGAHDLHNGSRNLTEEHREMEATRQHSSYIVVFENEQIQQLCTFFPESKYEEMKALMTMSLGENGEQHTLEDEEMRIERGKPLKFCPICTCSEKLGPDIDLDVVELRANASAVASSTASSQGEPWTPPELLVRDKKCPVSFSKRLDEVINNDTNTSIHPETVDESYKEIKDLTLHAVVNKLYEEIKSEYDGEWDLREFDMRKELVLGLKIKSFRSRRVMVLKKGTKCSNAKPSIDKDTILLYEKRHILRQLEHNTFVKKHVEKVGKIQKSEEETEHAFTLHVLRRQAKGGFSSCAMSSSRNACEFLNSSDFCQSFKPLGSGYDDSGIQTNTSTGAPSHTGQVPGTPPPQGGNGTVPPTNTSSGTQGTRESQSPSPPGSSQNPALGSGAASGTNQTGTSSEAISDASPEPDTTSSPTPSPINVSPSPSVASTNNSNSGLCFPSEAQVELEQGDVARMDELQVGDCIRDESGGFSKVILFTHANREVVTEFVRLETERADLVLSTKHYMPVNGMLQTAESVRTGDRVYVLGKGQKTEAMVIKVERVWKKGLFNPQTVSGSLAVRMSGEAVIASAYTAALNPSVAHSLLVPLRTLSNFAGYAVPASWMLKNGRDEIVEMFPLMASILAG